VVNGTLTAYLQVPAFVSTLAMLTIARGLAFIVSGGRSIGDLSASFGALGRAVILGIPAPVLVMGAVMLGGAFVLRRTVFGRHIYAIGGNTEAAWLAGVDTKRVIWWVYVLNGALAGIGGLTLASRLGAGVPNAGQQYELDVIAAVVVGGASLFGGRGTIAGTLWGTVFIGVLTNGLNLANVDPYVQKIALGVVIVLAVVGDEISRRRRAAG
jgi:ribose/xylose/arabinose/galactoside ABC-type transport system permease subunit